MEKNYQQAVDFIAEEARKLYPDPDDDQRDVYIMESVDGSSWIIFYESNGEVLQSTDNEPSGAEVLEMAPHDADWRKMRQIAANIAMEQDVREALDGLPSQSVA